MAEQKNDFTQGGIPATIARLALPLIGAQVINVLYSAVDKFFIGRMPGVGTEALTGVGVTVPIILIVSAFAMLAGMGGAPLCSIARGEKKYDYAERVMGNAFVLLIGFGVLITILALAFKRPILMWVGATEQVLPYADEYITVYLMGSVFVMMTLGMTPFINAQGHSRVAMLTVALGAVINIALDPLFLFTFGMGVRGAALATVLSQALSAAWVILFLTGKRAILKLKLTCMRVSYALVRQIIALGMSSFTMNVTDCIVSIVCLRTIRGFGGDQTEVYLGVMTVITTIRQLLMMPITGFGQGMQPVMGYNYGARRYDRVRESFKFTTLVSICYAVAASLLMWFLPEVFIRIFNPDGTLIEAGVPAIRLYFGLFFMLSLQVAGQYSFVALGKSKQAMFFSLLRKAFIVAPLVLLLPRVTGLGVMGVFAAEPISDLVGSTACFVTFVVTMWPQLRAADAKARA